MKTIKVRVTRNPYHSWYEIGEVYEITENAKQSDVWYVPLEDKNIYKECCEIVTDTITVTADKIRAMAAKSPQVKEVLKEGFPECFEEDESVDLRKCEPVMLVSGDSPFKGKAYYLDCIYNWKLQTTPSGFQYLIPTKK